MNLNTYSAMMGVMMRRGSMMMVPVAHIPGMGSAPASITSSVIGRRMMLHCILRWTLSLIFLCLASLVVSKVVEDTGGVPIAVKDPEHLDPLGVRHLLGVTRICHRLILVVFELDMP